MHGASDSVPPTETLCTIPGAPNGVSVPPTLTPFLFFPGDFDGGRLDSGNEMQSQRLGDRMTPVTNTKFQFRLLEMSANGFFPKLKE
jgi:hypothetical protein